jgi:hypothetical protein
MADEFDVALKLPPEEDVVHIKHVIKAYVDHIRRLEAEIRFLNLQLEERK